MRKLKEFAAKGLGFFMTASAVVAMSATAVLAQEVATRVGGIPCMFVAGQPKMPNSLLKRLEEKQ